MRYFLDIAIIVGFLIFFSLVASFALYFATIDTACVEYYGCL